MAGATLTGAGGGGPPCASTALPHAVNQAVETTSDKITIDNLNRFGKREPAATDERLAVMVCFQCCEQNWSC